MGSMTFQFVQDAEILTVRQLIRLLVVVLVLSFSGSRARAQPARSDEKVVIAVADSVLAALSARDGKTLARLRGRRWRRPAQRRRAPVAANVGPLHQSVGAPLLHRARL